MVILLLDGLVKRSINRQGACLREVCTGKQACETPNPT